MPLRSARRRIRSGGAVPSRCTCSSALGITAAPRARPAVSRGRRRRARTPSRSACDAPRSRAPRRCACTSASGRSPGADPLAGRRHLGQPDGVVDRVGLAQRGRRRARRPRGRPRARRPRATVPASGGSAATVTGAAGRWRSGASSRSAGPPSSATIAREALRRGAAVERALGRGPRGARRPARRRRARSSSALSASVTSRSRGSLAAPVRWSIDSRTSTRVAGGAAEHPVHVGQQRRGRAGRCRCATSTIARASSSACSRVGHEGARADLHVHHQRVEPGGELLRQDRGDDQRHRLDRAGGVADRVQPAVGGRELARSGRRSRSRRRATASRKRSRSGVLS